MNKWNKTSDGYPTDEKPVLVSDGKSIYAALAVWTECDDMAGWLWEVLGPFHSALNDTESYVCDDDYQFDYWRPLPAQISPLSTLWRNND